MIMPIRYVGLKWKKLHFSAVINIRVREKINVDSVLERNYPRREDGTGKAEERSRQIRPNCAESFFSGEKSPNII